MNCDPDVLQQYHIEKLLGKDNEKKSLSERDICTKYITPAIEQAGWDSERQIREEAGFTDGRIFVRGSRGWCYCTYSRRRYY